MTGRARSKRWRPGWAAASLALTLACFAACGEAPRRTIDIATTTSVQNSGLLDAILPSYGEEAGYTVRVHAAGSGRALQMLAEELVQLVISHAPDTEARMLQEHPDWVRREMAHNWFVVVGPPADPANVRGAADAADAFRRLVDAGAVFVSRGDYSGTHERENALWSAAGARPASGRLIVSGRGMAQALRHADQLQAYTLTDDATFRQLAASLELEVLFERDPRLLNRYSVVYPRDEADARRFADWMVEGEGRLKIQAYTIDGRPAFFVDPPD